MLRLLRQDKKSLSGECHYHFRYKSAGPISVVLTTDTAGFVADAIDLQTIRRWNVVEQISQSSDNYSIFLISQQSTAFEQLFFKIIFGLTLVIHGNSFNERDAGLYPRILVDPDFWSEIPEFYRSDSLSLLKLKRM